MAAVPDLPSPLFLLARVLDDDLDAALDAGLMDYVPAPGDPQLDPRLPGLLLQAQARLRQAWAARERHRRHQQRLVRRAAERQARRAPPADSGTHGPVPALPPAAAAALARAKARAGIAPR